MNFFHAAKYLEYIISAGHRNGHGIHSPFVFDLVSRIFRNKTAGDVVCTIEKIREQLISDRRMIIVNDLGSGSEKRKDNKRKMSEIARYSAVPSKYGILLHNLASEFGGDGIVEFGTSFGISTLYMSAGAPGSVIYTMEGCSECAEVARDIFSKAGVKNINLLVGPFETLLPQLKDENIKPGFVFIDGNHRKEPVLRYFNEIAGISGPDTIVAVDDIYDSREMTEAWEEIKRHEKVSVTVDIFRMGLVSFRQGIVHDHYKVRY
jgi:predicted O-methyltransferase YrrM